MNKKSALFTFTSSSIGICLLLCLIQLSSCQQESKSTATTADKTTAPAARQPAATHVPTDYNQSLQTILGDASKGLIRGVDFTMDKTAVKAKEKKANFVSAKQDGSLLYDIDLNENEFVDLNYIFDDNQALTGIKTDIYSQNKAAARQTYQTFEKHFNKTYKTIDKTTWQGEGLTAHLRLLNSAKDNGVIVEWRKK